MNKTMKSIVMALAVSVMLTSCYSYESVVGQGAQGHKEKTKWNHYAIGGLAPIAVSDTQEMAKGAEDYDVHTRITFVNSFCRIVTFGLYTPSTTTVTK